MVASCVSVGFRFLLFITIVSLNPNQNSKLAYHTHALAVSYGGDTYPRKERNGSQRTRRVKQRLTAVLSE